MSTSDTARLTSRDRRIIDAARQLAILTTPGARTRAGTDDTAFAYACLFGEARVLLTELAFTAERLGGEEAGQ